MSTRLQPSPRDQHDVDRQLPGHRVELRRISGPLRLIGTTAGAIGMAVIAALYVIGGPVVGLVTGGWQIVMEVRENAARPRPFVGARHGLPFLDPDVPAPPTEISMDDPKE
jgi:hypothetical protein